MLLTLRTFVLLALWVVCISCYQKCRKLMVMMALLDMLFGLKTSLLKALYDWMVAHSCFTFSNLLEFF